MRMSWDEHRTVFSWIQYQLVDKDNCEIVHRSKWVLGINCFGKILQCINVSHKHRNCLGMWYSSILICNAMLDKHMICNASQCGRFFLSFFLFFLWVCCFYYTHRKVLIGIAVKSWAVKYPNRMISSAPNVNKWLQCRICFAVCCVPVEFVLKVNVRWTF